MTFPGDTLTPNISLPSVCAYNSGITCFRAAYNTSNPGVCPRNLMELLDLSQMPTGNLNILFLARAEYLLWCLFFQKLVLVPSSLTLQVGRVIPMAFWFLEMFAHPSSKYFYLPFLPKVSPPLPSLFLSFGLSLTPAGRCSKVSNIHLWWVEGTRGWVWPWASQRWRRTRLPMSCAGGRI